VEGVFPVTAMRGLVISFTIPVIVIIRSLATTVDLSIVEVSVEGLAFIH